MRLLDPSESGARARAAVAYAGLSRNYKEVAERSGLSVSTVERLLAPSTTRGAQSIDELYAIADAFSVPRRFMDEGFDAIGDDDAVESRVSQTENGLQDVSRSLVALRREVSELRQRDADRGRSTEGGRDGLPGDGEG